MEQELRTLKSEGDRYEAYSIRFHVLVLMCPELIAQLNSKKIGKNPVRAYAATPAGGKSQIYAGNFQCCNRCNLHHQGHYKAMSKARNQRMMEDRVELYVVVENSRQNPNVSRMNLLGFTSCARRLEVFRIDLIPGASPLLDLLPVSTFRNVLNCRTKLKELQREGFYLDKVTPRGHLCSFQKKKSTKSTWKTILDLLIDREVVRQNFSKCVFWLKGSQELERTLESTNRNPFISRIGRILPKVYRKFLQDRQAPHLLTQKNKTYVWGDKQDEDFQNSEGEEKLCNAPVIALPDGTVDFVTMGDLEARAMLPRILNAKLMVKED
ncbi:hypothetical protein Tco_0277663 [Tanacetum coccineum]